MVKVPLTASMADSAAAQVLNVTKAQPKRVVCCVEQEAQEVSASASVSVSGGKCVEGSLGAVTSKTARGEEKLAAGVSCNGATTHLQHMQAERTPTSCTQSPMPDPPTEAAHVPTRPCCPLTPPHSTPRHTSTPNHSPPPHTLKNTLTHCVVALGCHDVEVHNLPIGRKHGAYLLCGATTGQLCVVVVGGCWVCVVWWGGVIERGVGKSAEQGSTRRLASVGQLWTVGWWMLGFADIADTTCMLAAVCSWWGHTLDNNTHSLKSSRNPAGRVARAHTTTCWHPVALKGVCVVGCLQLPGGGVSRQTASTHTPAHGPCTHHSLTLTDTATADKSQQSTQSTQPNHPLPPTHDACVGTCPTNNFLGVTPINCPSS